MQHLRSIARQNVHRVIQLHFPAKPTKHHSFLIKLHSLHSTLSSPDSISETQKGKEEIQAIEVHRVLEKYRDSATRKIELALDLCSPALTEGLVMNVIKRHRSDWKLAYVFFNWVSKSGKIPIGSCVYNEILDVLGKMRRFDELRQVFDEMSDREGLVNEDTYRVLVNRYSGAHKVEQAIEVFEKRREFGLEVDLVAFQKLLMCLCRYKHVEVAETLLHLKGSEFGVDIKTLNIVLNGWCVLNNVREAKRFWKDIILSKCKPDLFTYGTFIKALTKKGKLGTAIKLYRALWEEGCKPDVVICNCVIDALCFKKRVPEALEVFKEMNERGCSHNVATYNSLIKHLCKIRRMEKVYELLDEMEEKGGNCLPDEITCNYLLKSLKKPEEIPGVLERMKRNECEMTGDKYNLLLRLYAGWNCEEKVRLTWEEMEKNGLGPDRRSYTIIIHWLYDKGRVEEALSYFKEMKSRGMVPEPRTGIMVNAMEAKKKETQVEQEDEDVARNNEKSSRNRQKIKWKLKSRWKTKFR